MAPNTDPIRPIGPVAGDTYVSRTEYAERVTRRFTRDREGGSRGGHGHPHHAEDEGQHRHGATPEAPDAGAYDDHGRTMLSAPRDEPRHPHVDVSA